MHPRSYLLTALLTVLLLAVACVALAVIADPYRMFGTPRIRDVNVLKPRVYEHADLAKTYQLERIKPRTVLLGNSRTEIGFDPESKVWPSNWRPVFNAGLSGRSLFIASRMLQEALAAGPVKNVILQVDFPDFLTGPTPVNAPVKRRDSERRLLVTRSGAPNPDRVLEIWRDRLETTLTIDALADSVRTFLNQRSPTTETMTEFGFNPLNQYLSDVKLVGYYGIFAQKVSAYESLYRIYPHPDFVNPMEYQPFRDLAHIMETAHAHGANLIVFVPPYHAELLDIIKRAGLWPSFINWKQALARVIAKECRELNDASCSTPLVDFADYNAYSTEPIPPKGDTHTQTRWYWEPGHYKAALGDIMLRCLIAESCAFGRTLTGTSIPQVSSTAPQ